MVKKYTMDESKSWEERYHELEAHHVEETVELFGKLTAAKIKIAELEKHIASLQVPPENFWDGE